MGFTILGFCDQWDEYERRDYALMSRLAKFDDIENIIYIQPVLPLTSLVKFVLGRADQYATFAWRQVFSEGIVQKKGKITILQSFAILPYNVKSIFGSVNSKLTDWLRIFQGNYMLRKKKVSSVVLWISNPYFNSNLIGKFGERLICYNLCEDYAEKHSDMNYRRLLKQEDEVISRKADLLFMPSEVLVEAKKHLNNTYLIPNGVDYEHIRKGAEMPLPIDMEKIPLPIIGYIGLIGKHISFSLIRFLVKKRPNWSFVFVGPVSDETVEYREVYKLSNVYFLGSKSAYAIPSYLANFDVCTVFYPFNRGNEIKSSMKLYLYLASGKPIVSYPVGGAQNIPDLVYLANSPEEYLFQLEQALKEDSDIKVEKRLNYTKCNSWNERARDAHALITNKLGSRGGKNV